MKTLGAAILIGLMLPATAHAIANGDPAPAGTQPWMATIVGKRAGGAVRNERCGATLVAPDRLLTAAHCVEGTGPRQVRVLLGVDHVSTPGRELRVAAVQLDAGLPGDPLAEVPE